MTEQWKMVCKIKDIPLLGARLVQRGLAWQELPGVALLRTADDRVFALLDSGPQPGAVVSQGTVCGERVASASQGWEVELASGRPAAPGLAPVRSYRVKLEDGKVFLDLHELGAPASRAEAALAGAFAVTTHIEPA